MNVLITGSNGFIGSHLVEKLLTTGYHIKCLVRHTSDLTWLQSLPIEFVYGDITQFNSLLPIVSDVDYVYHLGGLVRAKDTKTLFQVNVEGTRNLLEACHQQAVALKRFIYVSSQAAAGPSFNGVPLTEDIPAHPISDYGKSKFMAENVVLAYGKFFPVTIIRPAVVYGPRDDDLLQAFKYIKLGVKPVLGTGEKKISIIFVKDLVQGLHLAGEHPAAENELFFMANTEAQSWIEIEDAIAQSMHKNARSIYIPQFGLDIVAFFSEHWAKLFNRPAIINRDKALEMKQNYWLVDSSKANKKLGFIPQIALEQGIKETYEWYQFQHWL